MENQNAEYTPSQVIDSPAPTSENPSFTPEPPKEEPKPQKMTAEQAISKAFDAAKVAPEEDEENAPPAKAGAKTENPPKDEQPKQESAVKEGKEAAVDPEKEDADGQAGKTKRELRSESLRAPPPAPARLIPSAREKWANVPQEVKFEVTRILEETDREITQYREHKQFREEVKEFEELAQRHGVPFKQALSNYVEIERKFSEDPAQGFRQLMQNMNMHPTQAIGAILRSVNATPQQLAQMLTNNPEIFTALAPSMPRQTQAQPQPQRQAESPEVVALRQQVEAMQARMIEEEYIKPFERDYPEYREHEAAIAEVLKSGIIEKVHGTGLSPRDRLEVALGMVAPHVLKRASQTQEYVQDNSVPSQRDIQPAVDLRGQKSIKGAPHGIETDRRRKMSKEDAINEAMARFGS
jgi:hypothetical protein